LQFSGKRPVFRVPTSRIQVRAVRRRRAISLPPLRIPRQARKVAHTWSYGPLQ